MNFFLIQVKKVMKDQKSKGVKVVKYIECSAIVQKNLKNVFDEAIKIAMFGERQASDSGKRGLCKII